MKCKKLVIETNGTSAGTKIFVDDQQLSLIQRINFSVDSKNLFTELSIEQAILGKTKKVRKRDVESQKFVEEEVPVVTSLLIEFER